MELADQGYRESLRELGNRPGLDSGDVTVTFTDSTSVTVPTTAVTQLGDLGLKVAHGGRTAFYPLSSVFSIADAD